MVDSGFLGTGWRFPPSFDAGGRRAAMVDSEEDIRESLRILLATTPGERVMQPAYGCDLRSVMFAEINAATAAYVKDRIKQAVLFFESRIDLEAINIDESEAEEGRLLIHLEYRVRATNSRSNLVYPFYLLEATNIIG